MPENGDSREEAAELKTLAEEKYNSGELKAAMKYAKRAHRRNPNLDGLSEILTAFQILRAATKPPEISAGDLPDYYKFLQSERFSHINCIKKQYKKLALTLHPDKHPFAACEEAFKLVGEAFRVLSDKIRRKEYDLKLRIAMQAAAEAEMEEETFWTACDTCRLLHKFNRRYIEHFLVCPSCKKSFLAVEVSENYVDCSGIASENEKISENLGTRVSARIKARKTTSVDKSSNGGEVDEEETITLAEMQKLVKKKKNNKDKSRAKEKETGVEINVGEKEQGNDDERANNENESEIDEDLVIRSLKRKSKDNSRAKEKETGVAINVGEKEQGNDDERANNENESEIDEYMVIRDLKRKRERQKVSKGESLEDGGLVAKRRRVRKIVDLDIMDSEDSDFYELDNDREEKNFKKGQVWAVYNDDDGMPRSYALIDEVLSINPFEVRLFWLDFQSSGDETSVNCVSCGRFKVSKHASVKSRKKFSHVMDCDRAAREIYSVYPKKGSVWAICNENKQYEVVVCLTSYTETYGLSVAYLEKVEGFKTLFKRREIGASAIRWLEKEEIRLMSHQIPAKKLSGDEVDGIPKDCWELDPASVPPEILTSRYSLK